jgi:hypothetical protein
LKIDAVVVAPGGWSAQRDLTGARGVHHVRGRERRGADCNRPADVRIFQEGTPTPTSIDTGTVFVTNQRVIFQGGKQTRECVFAKLVGFEHDDSAGSTTFSVSNRQKPTTIHYGRDLSGSFDFRCDLALAHFRGTLDAFVAELQDGLDELDKHRPPEPAQVQPQPAVINPPPQPTMAPGPSVEFEEPVETVSAGWYADPWKQAALRW